MSTDDPDVERIAKDLFRVVGQRMQREGLRPQDEMVGVIYASCMAAHYVMRGGGPALRDELIDLVKIAIAEADARDDELLDAAVEAVKRRPSEGTA